MSISTIDDFRRHIAEVQGRAGWTPPIAFGMGIATFSTRGDGSKILDTHFPAANYGENLGFAALMGDLLDVGGGSGTFELTADILDEAIEIVAPVLAQGGDHPNAELLSLMRRALDADAPVTPTRRIPVLTFIAALDDDPLDAHDVYLRLHLLSTREIAPHDASLEGAFGLLNNVVWTNLGPFDPDGFERNRAELRAQGVTVSVTSVDKFPRMTDYVVPSGVRIADADRVRLGAHLAEGTTVMHAGFVNFNAGTLGASMVEGRISAGVVLGAGTDIGGNASIMGTLSGGGKEVISVGEKCLLGANSGLGISLGDNCIVEAGLYLTAGAIVTLPDGSTCKAAALSGRSDMLFIRHSVSGAIEMRPQTSDWQGLNSDLHTNA